MYLSAAVIFFTFKSSHKLMGQFEPNGKKIPVDTANSTNTIQSFFNYTCMIIMNK